MRKFLIKLGLNAFALWAAAWVVDGITLRGGVADILIVALLFGLVNALLKPIAMLLSLPLILLSLGLFTFVVNGLMLLVTAALTARLDVSGLWAAVLGSLVISFVSMVLGSAFDEEETDRG